MKTDCFAFVSGDKQSYGPNGVRGCRALRVLDCNKCSFYRTQEQVEDGREAAEKRLKKIKHIIKGDEYVDHESRQN